MMSKFKIGVATLSLGFSIGMVEAKTQNDVEIKTEDLGHGIYVLFGGGGNIGVSVGEDGIIMIDDQFAPLTPKIMAAVAELSEGNVRFLINTHAHGDHTGGNENLGEMGAIIVSHDNLRTRLMDTPFRQPGMAEARPIKEVGLPVITFNDKMSFHLNGDNARAHHVPNSHTDADSFIHFEGANIIHMGDLMFNYLYPYIDVDSGGNVKGMITGVRRALYMANENTKIIPGHGPMASKKDLAVYLALLEYGKDTVQNLMAEGKSLSEILKMEIVKDYDKVWSWNFINAERFVISIYRSLEN